MIEEHIASSDLEPGPASTQDTSPPQDAAEASAAPSRDERIRQAAYARYEKRGGESGHDIEDWLAAEAEIEMAAGTGQDTSSEPK